MHTANKGLCPDSESIVINTTKLNKAYYNPSDKSVKVEAGITYGELAKVPTHKK